MTYSPKGGTFLYTNNERSERNVREMIPFTITSKRIKYLGINLPKDTKELDSGNYKRLMKEIKDDTKRWKDILCPWSGRIILSKSTDLRHFLSVNQWHFSQN